MRHRRHVGAEPAVTRVVTDGAADLPEGLADRLGITVVKGAVRIGMEPWRGDAEAFWGELGRRADLPATDAPTVEELAMGYGDDAPVLAVHVSHELSKTFAHGKVAATSVGNPVEVVDSRSLSVGTGLVAAAAAEAVRAGLDGHKLHGMVEGWVDQLHLHALIDDVNFLVHGGRAGLVAARAGRRGHRQVVAVKGHVIPICEVRHRNEAVRQLLAHVREHVAGGVARWAIGHGDAPDIGEFVDRLVAMFGCDPWFVTLVGAPVGSHMGPGSLVVGFLSDS